MTRCQLSKDGVDEATIRRHVDDVRGKGRKVVQITVMIEKFSLKGKRKSNREELESSAPRNKWVSTKTR